MRERLLRALRDEAREEIKEEVSHSDWGAFSPPEFEQGFGRGVKPCRQGGDFNFLKFTEAYFVAQPVINPGECSMAS